MGRPPDQRRVADDATRDRHRQVVLAQVQHRGRGGERDVGAVVDGEQPAVAARRLGEDLQQPQLVGRLETLLAQLHDVDTGAEHRVEELLEIALPAARVRAQVEPGIVERIGHARTLPGARGMVGRYTGARCGPG